MGAALVRSTAARVSAARGNYSVAWISLPANSTGPVGAPVGEPPSGSRLTASVACSITLRRIGRERRVHDGERLVADHAERARRFQVVVHEPQLVALARLRLGGDGADGQLLFSRSTDTRKAGDCASFCSTATSDLLRLGPGELAHADEEQQRGRERRRSHGGGPPAAEPALQDDDLAGALQRGNARLDRGHRWPAPLAARSSRRVARACAPTPRWRRPSSSPGASAWRRRPARQPAACRAHTRPPACRCRRR